MIACCALFALTVLPIGGCKDSRDKSSDGSAGEGFRLSLSKREALPLDGNTTP